MKRLMLSLLVVGLSFGFLSSVVKAADWPDSGQYNVRYAHPVTTGRSVYYEAHVLTDGLSWGEWAYDFFGRPDSKTEIRLRRRQSGGSIKEKTIQVFPDDAERGAVTIVVAGNSLKGIMYANSHRIDIVFAGKESGYRPLGFDSFETRGESRLILTYREGFEPSGTKRKVSKRKVSKRKVSKRKVSKRKVAKRKVTVNRATTQLPK